MTSTTAAHDHTLVVITGPTAVGKTTVSIDIAQRLNTEIVSADSRQFYKELKIGTAAPNQDELHRLKHHFVGHLSIQDPCNASDFEHQALKVIERIFKKNKFCVVTGGSGLYIDALWRGFDNLPPACDATRNRIENVFAAEGIVGLRLWLKRLDPVYYTQVDLANPNRIKRAIEVTLTAGTPFSQLRTHRVIPRPFHIRFVVLERPRNQLFERINQRVDQMVQEGLIEEALQLYRFKHLNALNTVGYKELFEWLSGGGCSLQQAIENIKTNTRRFAKRQITWFRRYPDALWVHPDNVDEIIKWI